MKDYMWSNKEIVEYRLEIFADCFDKIKNDEKNKKDNFVCFYPYFIVNKNNMVAMDVARDVKGHKTVVQIFTNIDRVYFLSCENDKLAYDLFEFFYKQL